jgi:hypothetical protein
MKKGANRGFFLSLLSLTSLVSLFCFFGCAGS